MTQLYPWPSRFLNIGRKKIDSKPQSKRNTRKKLKKTNVSSSKMIRVINQKISVVRSDIFISKKLRKTSKPSDMFTPIMNSFNSVSRQIVSRYLKPKAVELGRYPKKNPRFENHLKINQQPKKKTNNCIAFDGVKNLRTTKTKYSRKIMQKDPDNASREIKRPSSAPTEIRHKVKLAEEINVKNPRVMKRVFSEMKSLECSEKLYDIDLKFPNTSTIQKLRRSPPKPKRRQITSEICIEGLSDTFLLKYDSKLIHDWNPQLFGSLTSSTSSYLLGEIEKPMNILADKDKNKKKFPREILGTKKGENVNERRNTEIKRIRKQNRRIQHFISKIPDQSLTPLRRQTKKSLASKNLLKMSSSYNKSRNLFCETNVILEENAEAETIDIDLDRDLVKQKNEEIKQKFLDLSLKKQKSKRLRRKNALLYSPKGEILNEKEAPDRTSTWKKRELSLHNSENSSTSSRPCDKRTRRTKIKHEGSKSENKSSGIHAGRDKTMSILRKPSNELGLVDLQDIPLGELHGKSDPNCCKEFHKSLRRSFFTVSFEESQNNSSVYETCKTHFSGDDLFMDDSSNGRKPPPPTPNNERIDIETKNSTNSDIEVRKNTSLLHERVENVLGCLTRSSDHSCVSKTLPTASLDTDTPARISGELSTEERSEFPTNQTFTKADETRKMKREKSGKNIGGNYVEHLCEIDYTAVGQHILALHHKVEKIPSISDTYIHEPFPHLEIASARSNKKYNSRRKSISPNVDEDFHATLKETKVSSRNKQIKLPKCRWKGVPIVSLQGNSESNGAREYSKNEICTKRPNNVSSASNINSCTTSNTEIFEEKRSSSPVSVSSNFSNTLLKINRDTSWCSSEISSLASSPTEFLENTEKTMKSIVESIRGASCGSTSNITLTDILKDLSQIDHYDTFERKVVKGLENETSLEFSKKETDSQVSENIVDYMGKSGFIRISDKEMYSSKMELHSLDSKHSFSTVFLKSPSESYRISRESFPGSCDENM